MMHLQTSSFEVSSSIFFLLSVSEREQPSFGMVGLFSLNVTMKVATMYKRDCTIWRVPKLWDLCHDDVDKDEGGDDVGIEAEATQNLVLDSPSIISETGTGHALCSDLQTCTKHFGLSSNTKICV